MHQTKSTEANYNFFSHQKLISINMAAANWVCRALLLSLSLGLCHGNRAGLVTFKDDVVAKDDQMVSKNMSNSVHEVGDQASSPGNINGDNKLVYRGYLPIGDGVFCSTDGCNDHIIVPDPRRFIVGCDQLSGYSQCQWRLNDVNTIWDNLRLIQEKLDETCSRSIANIDSMNMAANAMPPN